MNQPLQHATGPVPAFSGFNFNRRTFMMTTAVGAGAAASAGASAAPETGGTTSAAATGAQETRVIINGKHHQLKQNSQSVRRAAAHAHRLERRVILQCELLCFLSWHRQQQGSGELRVRGRLMSS